MPKNKNKNALTLISIVFTRKNRAMEKTEEKTGQLIKTR